MTRNLPWDNPDADIVSDMIAVAEHFGVVSPYAAAAAAHLRRTFGRSQEAVDAAIRHLHVNAEAWRDVDEPAPHLPPVWTRPDDDQAPKYPIDTSRRRPVYGRFTEADITLDRDRIAAEYERLARKARRDEELAWIRDRTEMLAWINRYRDRAARRRAALDGYSFGNRPRQAGKTREHAEAALWAQRAYGAGHVEVGPGYVAIYDETARYRRTGRLDRWPIDPFDPFGDEVWRAEQAERRGDLDATKAFFQGRLRPYLQVADQVADEVADRTGVPRDLLQPRPDA